MNMVTAFLSRPGHNKLTSFMEQWHQYKMSIRKSCSQSCW